MTMASVTITHPLNRRIYINGNYAQPRGNSSGLPLSLPPGGYIVETLNGAQAVDFRKDFIIETHDTARTIALDPVVPPQPI